MKKVVITILGRNDYQLAKYQIESFKPKESKLVGGVLKEIIQPDEIYVIGTDKSSWQISDEYIKDYKKVIIPYGMNTQEFWSMFDTIAKLPVEKSEIYFDVTHGFRSIPIFISTLLNFFTKVKKAEVKGVYYGIWDATSQNNGITPVVNILPLLEMNEIIDAFTIFKEYSDGRRVANFLSKQFQAIPNDQKRYFKKIQELNRELDFYSKTVGFSALEFYHQTLDEIKQLIQEIEGNEQIRQYFKTVGYIIEDFKKELQIYDGLTTIWQRDLKTAKAFFEKNRYAQALTILRETVLTYILEILEMDIMDENLREDKLGTILFEEQERLKSGQETIYFEKEFIDIYQKIRDLRNKSNHAFIKKEVSKKSINNSVDNLKKYLEQIEALLRDRKVFKVDFKDLKSAINQKCKALENLKNYANPYLRDKEEKVWQEQVVEKFTKE